MVLEIGSNTALSFTDDTSLDTRNTNSQKVSIHAEVLREKPLEWYFKLISRYPDIKGELKSSKITECFFSLSKQERNRLLCTLKFVRIHISDPRPYVTEVTNSVKKALGKILPEINADDFLVKLSLAQNEVVREMADMLKRQAARIMMRDSPAEKLKLWLRVTRRNPFDFATSDKFPFLRSSYSDRFFRDFDFTPFEDKKGHIRLNTLSVYSSKSGPVFTDALEDITNNPSRYSSILGGLDITRKLSTGRAYDIGDEKAIGWLRDKREEVIEYVDEYDYYPWMSHPSPIETLESNKSILIQAADFAAGIAKTIIERFGLISLVKTFDTIIYNGERLSEEIAAKIMKLSTAKTMSVDRIL